MKGWTTARSSSKLLIPSSCSPVRKSRLSSSFAALESELKSRKLPILHDAPTPFPSHLLDATLADFLPASPISSYPPSTNGNLRKMPVGGLSMRPGHHLLYYHSPNPLSSLLQDGTDPEQSPGAPFVRRMWAGGQLKLRLSTKKMKPRLIGCRGRCVERISDVVVKGAAGQEKLFVTIERRFTGIVIKKHGNNFRSIDESRHLKPDELREQLQDDKYCSMIEYRNLVFMRERSESERALTSDSPGKILKPQHAPTVSHTLTPTQDLLFRFSALTFNTHRIHLDKRYCQEVEGYRNLLVHGPLCLILMLEVLGRHLAKEGVYSVHQGKEPVGYYFPFWEIKEVEYRNLSPLYAEEPMKVCARAKDNDEWDIWIENKDGGYAVKGVAKTKRVDPKKRQSYTEPKSED